MSNQNDLRNEIKNLIEVLYLGEEEGTPVRNTKGRTQFEARKARLDVLLQETSNDPALIACVLEFIQATGPVSLQQIKEHASAQYLNPGDLLGRSYFYQCAVKAVVSQLIVDEKISLYIDESNCITFI